jgi:hypothetical protein
MKQFLLWSFDRGSLHYDVMCGLILAFIFIIPHEAFNDRPEYMQVSGERVHRTEDKNGNTIYTVKLEMPVFFDGSEPRSSATKLLEKVLAEPVKPSKHQPIYDWTDRLIAYAIWIER